MEIEDKIIAILKDHGRLKANDIVLRINEKFNNDIDVRTVNKVLYYKLKDKVYQDSNYRWSLDSGEHLQQPQETNKYADTPLSRLSSYYLDCLSRDMEAGLSVFASSKYESLDYGQLTVLPQLTDDIANLYSSDNCKRAINKVRQDKHRLVLQLGYPVYLRKARSNSTFFVEPLLLIPFDTQSFLYGGTPSLMDEVPRFNFESLSKLSGLRRYELFEEAMTLSDELGINNPSADQPNFEEVAIRLQQIRPQWKWIETVHPDNLTSKKLKEASSEGIYNAAAIFFSERSKYTQGLEKELTDFKKLNIEKYKSSALGHWISREFPAPEQKDIALIEPLPLNDEQRNAVRKALQSPLTVVTGPPGTGKSQVVTSIIINAVYQGQKVLFASKNHKAVDVVEERVNGLTSKPVMLRLGSNELQSELAQYLSGLLSSNTSKVDNDQYETAKQKHDELIKRTERIKHLQSDLLRIRNITDKLEQDVENFREALGDDLFAQIKNWDETIFQDIDVLLKKYSVALQYADRAKQPFLVRLFWFIIKKARFEKAASSYKNLKKYISLFNVKDTEIAVSENSLALYLAVLNQLNERLQNATDISTFFKSLRALQNHKSLFQLSMETKVVEDETADNSQELWETWLRLLPDKLTEEQRKAIGDYTALLNIIVAAKSESRYPDKNIRNQFDKLQGKVTNILSCWAVTSLSVKGRVPFESGFFDLVIIDEASQCDIASALPLLYRSKRAVIIGDSKQLTHICSIDTNQDIQLLEKYDLREDFLSWSYTGHSLFELAQGFGKGSDNIVVLRDHHRSHADIINFSNKEFYDGNLRIATNYEKLKRILDEPVVRWKDIVGNVVSPSTGSSLNPTEAEAVVRELKRLIDTNYNGTIGVVTPFRPQANRIRDLVNIDQRLSEQLIKHDFLVDTVNKFQGDERDIMIFSPVVSSGMREGSKLFLARTGNLFNVAITRARAALIIVGDKNACSSCGVKYMERFVKYVNQLKPEDIISEAEEKDYGPIYPPVSSSAVVSDWEKILYVELYKKGIRTMPQYQIEQYALDLALCQGKRKLDIEIDGEKYHKSWDGELCRRDQIRNMRLIELGWDVMRFWVYEVRDDINTCVNRIQAWHKNTTENLIQAIDKPEKDTDSHTTAPTISSIKTTGIRSKKCRFCGSPAMPGDNVCFNCKSE